MSNAGIFSASKLELLRHKKGRICTIVPPDCELIHAAVSPFFANPDGTQAKPEAQEFKSLPCAGCEWK
jgi:hypothetical protein